MKTLKSLDSRKNQGGFTLIELLIVVVIAGVIAAISILGYMGVLTGTRNKVATTRLMEAADAQARFRTGMGKRRYASIQELCEHTMVPETVINFDSSCQQTAIDGWSISAPNEDADFLKDHFFLILEKARSSSKTHTPAYCMGDDGVVRRASDEDPTICTLDSEPYKQ